ncbi:MAG: bifunctional (p)ppGpp synthetase/guanosine-3',5'-bis(diphosphate) 3'-pyrophosphohydrolase [Burkholderiales bacterium]|nr:bifunctional (p)ppGpp synthetase/guanosine-3',5'-bis(diphosphate) 3'-pyrophosphohydrolase [Burkholderiales bacterium]
MAKAVAMARAAYGQRVAPSGEPVIEHAQALADILAYLGTDADTQLAAVLYGTVDAERAEVPLSLDQIRTEFGADVASIVQGSIQLMQVTELVKAQDKTHEGPQDGKLARQQAEALRKMLLAMVGDLRVVLVRMVSRLRTLRFFAEHKDQLDGDLARQYAQETFELYAPLANRLGIWQLKWELEDLAFRFLQPETYKRIAKMLEEKRLERQAFISEAIERLKHELRQAGIQHAEVYGRPKHIYSIWNKMRGKGVDFAGLYDVRAFRVIVDDVKQCYTVLGIIHHLWQPIPKEFDDYISRPKSNGYQSLHTVVVADDGKPFEVQIRTREMHQFAEYGVAAHWRYKESGNKSLSAHHPYDEKIAWIRQLFAWKNEVDQAVNDKKLEQFDAAEWTEKLKSASIDDRIYVMTPQARVIDLPTGATPVDFAYHLHSDLGHRCRGAKVNAQMVPLNTPLKTGQTVEIIASKAATAGPSRDWLNLQLGYLASTRARTKVRAWFNAIEHEEAMHTGRLKVERELQRLGKTSTNLEEMAHQLGYAKAEDLFIAVTRDEFNFRQIEALFNDIPLELPEPVLQRKPKAGDSQSGVMVVGVSNLMTQLARCCKPAPPDAISGFVTRGKGISIHRADCKSFLTLAEKHPERVIDTSWGHASSDAVYAVDVLIQAQDRHALLRDISDVFAREKINVVGVKTQSSKGEARMQFTAEVKDAGTLAKALQSIREVTGVLDARRR